MVRRTLPAAMLLVLAQLWPLPAQAQDYMVRRPRATVTTNPVALVDGRINFEFEGAINRRVSGFAGLNFLVLEPQFGDSNGRVFGVGPELGLRLFLLGSAPEGIWLGPTFEISYLNYEGNSDVGLGVGGMAGFTWIAADIFTLSLGGGFAYENFDVDIGDNRISGVAAIVPKFRFSVGVAF